MDLDQFVVTLFVAAGAITTSLRVVRWLGDDVLEFVKWCREWLRQVRL